MGRRRNLVFLLVGVGLATAAAFSVWVFFLPRDPDPSHLPMPPATGKTAYEKLLLDQAGTLLDTEEMVRLARREVDCLETRMDQVAERIEAQASWRQVFADLGRQHPDGRQKVLAAYRDQVARATAFVRRHDLVSLPAARLEVLETPEVLPKENYPLAAYLGYKLVVTTSLSSWPWQRRKHLRNHCIVCIPPLVVHEAVPGHHVSFLHTRLPKESPDPQVEALAQVHFKNKFFYEGWAQYAEVLMLEEGFYDDPAEELGAWRMLLLRALRMWIDPLLHTGEMTPQEAVRLLETRLLMNREAAHAEVRRHFTEPTMKASYYVGMLQILTLRRILEQHGPAFEPRKFHDRVLEWPLPIPTLAQIQFGVELPPLNREFQSPCTLVPVTPDPQP